MIVCSLCGSHDLSDPLDKLKPSDVVSQWQSKFNININDEFLGIHEISLYRCNTCGIKFFLPLAFGSEIFYSQLEAFDWYYLDTKWEFSVALKDLKPGISALEIGCGEGKFIEMAQSNHINIMGIEINNRAVLVAQKKGLNVQIIPLEDLIKSRGDKFDAVCAFQVLEHVANPREFLTTCVTLLRPGGKLILSVPNSDGFIKYSRNNLLDQPPHHVSRWSRQVFNYLPHLLPVYIHRIRFEPLAAYHLEFYVNSQINRVRMALRTRPTTTNLLAHAAPDSTATPTASTEKGAFTKQSLAIKSKRLLVSSMQRLGWYKLLRGHTIYVCFNKLPEKMG